MKDTQAMPARSAPTGLSDSFMGALPDLVLSMRRDGLILAFGGGQNVGYLKPDASSIGRPVDEIWPAVAADLVKQLARRAISTRTTGEARFHDRGLDYEARVSAQGPRRVVCIIRLSNPDVLADEGAAASQTVDPQIERRGFLRRFAESASICVLRGKPMAAAVIHLGGISDIAEAVAPTVAEQITTSAILRLGANQQQGCLSWYLGQLSDSLLAVVFESVDREAIETSLEAICNSLREPVAAASGNFQLTPTAGVAILGQDCSSPRGLLDQARAAANEARRGGEALRFFTDTLRLKALARLDVARELHEAIERREIQLRYVGRHDLATGQLHACVGYLQWLHPLRGEIRPAEFLRIAETTGLGTTLSRAAMQWLQDDYVALSVNWTPEVRISFGALRHHLSHEDFVTDFERLIAEGVIPPERLELRITERNLSARRPVDFQPLARVGIQLIVDELGRGSTSFEWLARAPLHGLQLDRAWMVAARTDDAALKVCRAYIAATKALGLLCIVPGVDDEEQRDCASRLGCQYGSGDLYARQTVSLPREGNGEISD